MHEFAVEWLSLKETGADAQGNQLTAEENHDCCSLHETLETLTNSRRRRRSGRPEVKMHYWRMRKTKLESSFRSGRLATRVSEVVFGRWVFIHFFCLLSNMPWKHNHISVFLMIFWNQRYLSDSSWRNCSMLTCLHHASFLLYSGDKHETQKVFTS